MKRIGKYLGLGLLAALVIWQFIKPERNQSNDNTYGISTKYQVPAEVQSILEVACNDCHTNNTEYPWYANVQPVASWINHHVVDGKRHLNLSEFTNRRIAIQNHKLEEIIEQVKENEMPLPSYTWIHKDAKLTDAQKETLVSWAEGLMNQLAASYPADSLKMPQRPPR